MEHQMTVELVVVVGRTRFRELVDRSLGRQPQCQSDVSELEIEVDENDAQVATRQRHREVRRDKRLAGPTLRAEDTDEGRNGRPGVTATLAPGEHLLEREPQL